MKADALAEEPDPYLSLNEKIDAVLSDVGDLTDDLEKLEAKADFSPSMMRSILAALKGLKDALDDRRDAKPPTITVQAPAVTVPAPNVTIQTDTPKKWRIRVTDREDDTGRIKEMTIEAAK